MNLLQHLTPEMLSSYSTGLLNEQKAKEIGKHLILCADCRASLPVPTPQRFFAILTTENNKIQEENYQKDKAFYSFFPIYSYLSSFFQSSQKLVWSSGVLVLILTFSLLILLNSKTPIENPREAATSVVSINDETGIVFNTPKKRVVETTQEETLEIKKILTPAKKKKVSDINQVLKKQKSNKQETKLNSKTKNIRQNIQSKNMKKEIKDIAATRGTVSECKEDKLLNIEFIRNKESVVLKWKKVPNAKKYHLYISDDEEILVDEFETETSTLYVLSKTLDRKKTYKWKIVIILENGETIVGAAEKFTVKNLQMNENKISKKGKLNVRCSDNSRQEIKH